MNVSDDIAEKVGDLLIQETAKAGAKVIDTAPTVVDGIYQGGKNVWKHASDAFLKASAKKDLKQLEEAGEKLVLPHFMHYAHKLGLKVATVQRADADSAEFERLLRKEKMAFAAMDSKRDDYTVFVFFDKDLEKVKHAEEALKARRGKITELKADDFLNMLEPDKLTVLSNVTDVEVELFRHFARDQGLLFAHIPGSDGKEGQIIYQPRDAEKARKAMLSVGWALTSAEGARVREQVQHYIKGRTNIKASIEDTSKELYIVSSVNTGHAIRITEDDFQVYKAGACINAVSRNEPDFFTKCMVACETISGAVVLTKEEFESPDTTPETIRQMPTIDLFPRDIVEITDEGFVNNLGGGYEELMEQDRLNSIEHLISMKISSDNEGNASWGTYDTSVSFSEFSGYEHYRDAEEERARESEFNHYNQAFSYGKEKFDPQEVDMTDRSIDYVISRAYIRSGTRPEPEQEARTHQQGDRLL